MGRPSKPTTLKVLEGNPGKRRINKAEPIPVGKPSPPKFISKDAAEIWKRVVSSMPSCVYTAADESLLHAYCEWVVVFRNSAKALTAANSVTLGSTGQPTVSPNLKIMGQASSQMVALGSRLGLDPVSRKHIEAEPDAKDELNPFGIT